MSTSGDDERCFDDGAGRCHHVPDPHTGFSPQAIHSVTVVAPGGLTNEALAKTVFMLDVETGLRIVESLPDVDCGRR